METEVKHKCCSISGLVTNLLLKYSVSFKEGGPSAHMVYAGVLCHNEAQVLICPSVFFPVGLQ